MAEDSMGSGAIAFLVVFLVGLLMFVGAVWFGLRILAPRIGHALDRAEPDEEEPGDRSD